MVSSGRQPDGRRQRRATTLTALAAAHVDLNAEGVAVPSPARLAERSGLSERTVYRVVEDLDHFVPAFTARGWRRWGDLHAPPDDSGDRAARIAALVRCRVALYDATAAHAVALTHYAQVSEAAAEAVRARRTLLRHQVARQFAPELAAAAGPTDDLTHAVDVLTSIEGIDALREGGLGEGRVAPALHLALHDLFEAVDPRGAVDR